MTTTETKMYYYLGYHLVTYLKYMYNYNVLLKFLFYYPFY